MPRGSETPPGAMLECPPGTVFATKLADGTTRVANVHCARSDGTRHGPFVSFFPDGRQHFIGEFREGRKHGEWIEHNSSGVFMRIHYRDGQLHGPWQIYSAPGVLQSETEYVDGEEVRATFWNADGSTSSSSLKQGPTRTVRMPSHREPPHRACGRGDADCTDDADSRGSNR